MDASPVSTADGIVRLVTGEVTGDDTDITVSLGFTPRWVKIVNITAVEVYEKLEGMGATQTVKTVTAGTTTIDTGSAIVFGTSDFTIDAAAVADGDNAVWIAA